MKFSVGLHSLCRTPPCLLSLRLYEGGYSVTHTYGPPLIGNPRSPANGLPAYAGTQRNGTTGGVHSAVVHVKSHVAHSDHRGKHHASGTAQDRQGNHRSTGEDSASGPQGKLHGSYRLPCRTPNQEQQGGVDETARYQSRACLDVYPERNRTHEPMGLHQMPRLRTKLRAEEGLLFKVWRQAEARGRIGIRAFRADPAQSGRENLAPYSQGTAKPPFFVHTPASGDDGFSSQPERTTTGYPDTAESGDTYNAEMFGTNTAPWGHSPRIGAPKSPVVYAYYFLRTTKLGWCYWCQGTAQRHRTHWLICKDKYHARICRRCMIRTGVYRAFLTWLVNPW
jgi:hypothetical protein